MLFADWVIFILSIFMIAVSALQTSKEDVMDAFTGGNSDLFKNKKSSGGAESLFNKSMLIMGILFFIMILWSNSIDRFFN